MLDRHPRQACLNNMLGFTMLSLNRRSLGVTRLGSTQELPIDLENAKPMLECQDGTVDVTIKRSQR